MRNESMVRMTNTETGAAILRWLIIYRKVVIICGVEIYLKLRHWRCWEMWAAQIERESDLVQRYFILLMAL
jgi:hypothetical protein